jgi:hypothetical protein
MSAAHKPMPRNKMVIFKGAGAPSLQAAASLAEAVSPPTDAAREA